MKKKKPRKATFVRHLVIRNCKHDFGLGPGIIFKDEIRYTDERGLGWDHDTFALVMILDAEKLIKEHVTVLMERKKKK